MCYHSYHCIDSSVHPSSPQPSDSDASSESSTDSSTAALVADVEVVGGLQDLESDFSSMMTDTRKDLANCDIGEVQFYLDDLFDVDEFRTCQNIDEVLRKLCVIVLIHSTSGTWNALSVDFTKTKPSSKLSRNMKRRKRSFSEPQQSKNSNRLW